MKDTLVGWMAVGARTERTLHLSRFADDPVTGKTLKVLGPRGPLLKELGVKNASRMYCDLKDGSTRHVGYVCGGDWWTIREVHTWRGTGR